MLMNKGQSWCSFSPPKGVLDWASWNNRINPDLQVIFIHKREEGIAWLHGSRSFSEHAWPCWPFDLCDLSYCNSSLFICLLWESSYTIFRLLWVRLCPSECTCGDAVQRQRGSLETDGSWSGLIWWVLTAKAQENCISLIYLIHYEAALLCISDILLTEKCVCVCVSVCLCLCYPSNSKDLIISHLHHLVSSGGDHPGLAGPLVTALDFLVQHWPCWTGDHPEQGGLLVTRSCWSAHFCSQSNQMSHFSTLFCHAFKLYIYIIGLIIYMS